MTDHRYKYLISAFSKPPFSLVQEKLKFFIKYFGMKAAIIEYDTAVPCLPYSQRAKFISAFINSFLKTDIDWAFFKSCFEKRNLQTFLTARKYKFLFGSLIVGQFEGIKVGYSVNVDGIFDVHDCLYIDDIGLLDAIEENEFGIKRVRKTIVPKRGLLDLRMFNGIRTYIQEISDEVSV